MFFKENLLQLILKGILAENVAQGACSKLQKWKHWTHNFLKLIYGIALLHVRVLNIYEQ